MIKFAAFISKLININMKKYLLFLVLVSSTTFLNAQCEIDNDSFEDWTLEDLTGSGVDFSEVLLPDSVAQL